MKDYALDLLVKMLEIHSPYGQEEALSQFLLERIKEFGIDARKDNVGNIIAKIGQGEPKILLCGHMDTVPGEIEVRMEGGKLYGRGAVDAKSPLAAMIMAFRMLAEVNLPGEITLAGVVDEEGAGLGIRNLMEKGISADYAIFGEPSGVDNITIGYKGSLHLKVSCETESGHSSAPWLYDNAIEKGIELWEMIRKNHLPQEKLESRFYSSTYCLTKMCGGSSLSMTPSNCEFLVDVRIPPQLTPEQVFDSIQEVVDSYRAKNEKVRVNVSLEGKVEPFETDKDTILVRSLSWAIRKTRKSRVTLLKKTGTADINELSLKLKIPMVAYGPGNSYLDHTPNEHIVIDDYLDSIQICREAIMRLFELHNRKIGDTNENRS